MAGVAISALQAAPGATSPAAPWVVNGSVDALALSGHTLYLGGGFTQVSPRTGPLLGFSPSGAARAFPAVEGGEVRAVVGDGKGGWFVGGYFERIGGVACPNLAHVTSARTVDRRFCPRPNDIVLSLAVDGSTLYVGGEFGRVATAGRPYLAALDAATGKPTPWRPPSLDAGVTDIAVRNGVLYLLGDFDIVGGKDRFTLAAVDERTANVTAWDPKAPPYGGHDDPSVYAIAASPTAIYVGGLFDHIGGEKRAALAALDPVTGNATAWVPHGPWAVESLVVAGGRLYVGGTLHASGDGKSSLTAYDLASGRRASWAPAVGPEGVVAIAVDGSRVYAADDRLEAFDAGSARRLAWRPALPNDRVDAIAPSAQTVVVGGEFNGAGGVSRDGLAALDLRTGRPTAWHPAVAERLGGPEANAIAIAGKVVYVGGSFDHLGGKPRHLVGAVDATTGTATAWVPSVTGDQILSLAVAGSKVYVGGFDTGSAFDRSGRLAWHSPPTGRVANVQAVALAGGDVYFGGSFDIIGGRSRPALAALDPGDGAATDWNARLAVKDGDPQVQALAVSGSTLFVGGSFESAGGAKRANLASYAVTTGKLTTWAPKSGPAQRLRGHGHAARRVRRRRRRRRGARPPHRHETRLASDPHRGQDRLHARARRRGRRLDGLRRRRRRARRLPDAALRYGTTARGRTSGISRLVFDRNFA